MCSKYSGEAIELRPPHPEDGAELHRLVNHCPPLDENSLYCNLLQCTHFRHTSVLAVMNGEVVGAITGYLLPAHPGTLFIWQVAVHEVARGKGLARQMLANLLERDICAEVTHLETTVTPSNDASRAMFAGFAREFGLSFEYQDYFQRDTHFNGQHEAEELLRIGPIPARTRPQSSTGAVRPKELFA